MEGQPQVDILPTFKGYLKTDRDVLIVLNACLEGKLLYAARPPRSQHDFQAVLQDGHVFFYFDFNNGPDDWDDGKKWDPVQSGRSAKTERHGEMFRAKGHILYKTVRHRYVAYYSECNYNEETDTLRLKRPSTNPDLTNIGFSDELRKVGEERAAGLSKSVELIHGNYSELGGEVRGEESTFADREV